MDATDKLGKPPGRPGGTCFCRTSSGWLGKCLGCLMPRDLAQWKGAVYLERGPATRFDRCQQSELTHHGRRASEGNPEAARCRYLRTGFEGAREHGSRRKP